MKTATSLDMMTADSFMSPHKNHSQSTNFEIVPSMSFVYSSPSSTSGTLKIVSNEKINLSRNLISQMYHQNPEEHRSSNRKQVQLEEVFQTQRKLKQVFIDFMDNHNLISRNQEKIHDLCHKNKLAKNQCLHVKEMINFNQSRVKKLKIRLKRKIKTEKKRVLNKISHSKERTKVLFEQIYQLRHEINKQKKLEKQIDLLKLQRNFQQSIHFDQQHPNQYFYRKSIPFYPDQNQFPPSGLFIESPLSGRTNQRNTNKKESFSQAQTSNLQSKKSPPGSHVPPINPQNLIQALAFQLKQITSPIAHSTENNQIQNNLKQFQLINNLVKLSGKWENNGEQKQVLSMLNQSGNKRIKTIESNQSDSQPTPQFFMKNTESQTFSDLHNRISTGSPEGSFITRKQPNYLNPIKNHLNSSVLNDDQSKANIDVDQSVSSISKLSLKKQQKNNKESSNIKSSTVRVIFDDSSRQRSGENSPNNNQILQMRDRSFTDNQQKNSNNSSFEKVIIQEATSEILVKPLPPPPKLPSQTLRKVTEQQSDFLKSNKDKKQKQRLKHNSQKLINSKVQDVVLDGQNQKNSQIFVSSKIIKKNDLNDPGINEKEIKFLNLGKQSKVFHEQEQDEDDFMKINLVTVSKISKQKELSERNWKSIELDQQQIGSPKKTSNDKPLSLNNSSMPVVNEEDLHGKQQQKIREQSKLRKSSETQFSMIEKSKFDGSKSQQN